MSSPPQQRPPPPAAPPTVTSPPPATATQPLPRTFLATSAPQRAAAATPTPPPPLFTGRPLNPNPTHASPAHGILYPVATSSYPAAAAAAAAVASHRRIPQLSVGYPRAHAVAVPIAPSPQPQVPTQPRSYAAVPRAVVAGVTPRPEQPPRGVPIAPQPQPQPQPKVNPVPAVTPSPQEPSNTKERETTKEDTSTVVINDRKVNVLDSESGSLYALCRSWVRNGVPHEIQPSFVGNVAPLLPRPLPASVVDSRLSEKDNDAEDQDSEEEKNDIGEYTAADLLKQHVTRAKKIRAKLRKERQVRIERYKQRLALLLPPPPPPPSEQ